MLRLQSLNNCYYRIEWEENKEIGKANAIRVISSVFKILTVIFAVIAVFSFMNIAMLIGFCVGAAVCLTAVIAMDYLAGTLLYSYAYVLSDGVLELKREYRNGKSETYLKSACKDITVKSGCEDTDNIDAFFPKSGNNSDINYCFITNSENNNIKIAVDDYMLAILRRICK